MIKLLQGRILAGRALVAASLLLLGTCFLSSAFADQPRTINLLRPLDGATVREVVPIKISPADLPSDGYVTVSIDKVFRSAQLIEPGNPLIYKWDTQASYQDPNNPGVDQYTDDGNHEIEVAVYDRQGTLLAEGKSTVKLANKVANLPDGVKLYYNWSYDQTLRYKRHSELNILSTGGAAAAENAETADIRFARSVEDATGGEYLVRDLVYQDGIIATHGAASPVQSLFNLKSRYRTVNKYGETLVEETPFSTGDHFGFPIPEVPGRRITVGDSWQAKIEVSVPWADEKPTELDGTARLDSFEWQNGYPTAKVIETYDGPGQLYADPRGSISFDADNIHLVRTYWFAYNSKLLVRVKTDMIIDGNVGPDVVGALGAESSGPGQNGAPGTGPQQNIFGEEGNDQNPGQGPGNFGAPGPNMEPGGTNTVSTTSPIKIEVIDDMSLLGI